MATADDVVRGMDIRIYRHGNAWHVSFDGSMALPFKHLDTVIDHLQRKYPGSGNCEA
jgi:hypothetical protein